MRKLHAPGVIPLIVASCGPPGMIRLGPDYPGRIFPRPTISGGGLLLLLVCYRFLFFFMDLVRWIALLPHGNHPPRPLSGSWIPHFLALSPAASPPGMGIRIFRRCIAFWPSPQVFPRRQFQSTASDDRARLSGQPDTLFPPVFPGCQVKQLPPPGNEPGHESFGVIPIVYAKVSA